jgi:hypothetical protein
VIHQKERHSCSGSDGAIADLMQVESEQSKTPQKKAGVLEYFSHEGVADFKNLLIESN